MKCIIQKIEMHHKRDWGGVCVEKLEASYQLKIQHVLLNAGQVSEKEGLKRNFLWQGVPQILERGNERQAG